MFGAEHPTTEPEADTHQGNMFDAAAEAKAMESGRPLSQERAEIVAPSEPVKIPPDPARAEELRNLAREADESGTANPRSRTMIRRTKPRAVTKSSAQNTPLPSPGERDMLAKAYAQAQAEHYNQTHVFEGQVRPTLYHVRRSEWSKSGGTRIAGPAAPGYVWVTSGELAGVPRSRLLIDAETKAEMASPAARDAGRISGNEDVVRDNFNAHGESGRQVEEKEFYAMLKAAKKQPSDFLGDARDYIAKQYQAHLGDERGFVQLPQLQRLSVAERGKALRDYYLARDKRYAALFPKERENMFDPYTFLPRRNAYAGEVEAGLLRPSVVPDVGKGIRRGPHKVFATEREARAAGKELRPEFTPAQAFATKGIIRERDMAIAQAARELAYIRDLHGREGLPPMRYYHHDPSVPGAPKTAGEAARLADQMKPGSNLPGLRVFGKGESGFKSAEKYAHARAEAEAPGDALDLLRKRLRREPTADEILKEVPKVQADIAQRLMEGAENEPPWAKKPPADIARYVRPYHAVHAEALPFLMRAGADANSAERVSRMIASIQQLGHALRDPGLDGAMKARATQEILGSLGRTSFSNALQDINHFVRNLIVANPVVHPFWNLFWNFVGAGGKLEHFRIGPLNADDLRLERELETHAGGAHLPPQMTHLGPESDLEKHLLPFNELTTRGKIDKVISKVFDANRRFVFNVMERRYSIALYRSLKAQGMDPFEAATKVRGAFGDYTNLTQLENNIQQAFYFYPWMKTNMAFWAQTALADPRIPMSQYLGTQAQVEAEGDESKGGYYTASRGVDPISGEVKKWALPFPARVYPMIVDAAFGQPSNLTNYVEGHINPIFRTPVDLMYTQWSPAGMPGGADFHKMYDKDAPPWTKAAQIAAFESGNLIAPARQYQGGALSALGGTTYSRPSDQQQIAIAVEEKQLRPAIHDAQDRGDMDTANDLYEQLQELYKQPAGAAQPGQ